MTGLSRAKESFLHNLNIDINTPDKLVQAIARNVKFALKYKRNANI